MNQLFPVEFPTAGESTCPICRVHWTVTPMNDCSMPACGCYGHDATEANPNRPCEPCGVRHAWSCPNLPGRRRNR